MTLIGILAIIVVLSIPSQSYSRMKQFVDRPINPVECPAGQVKDWAGICWDKSVAKACITCAPGSAAPAENPSPQAAKASTAKNISICREILTKSSEAGSTASPSDIQECKAFFMVR